MGKIVPFHAKINESNIFLQYTTHKLIVVATYFKKYHLLSIKKKLYSMFFLLFVVLE
jgi:hypothetical protein